MGGTRAVIAGTGSRRLGVIAIVAALLTIAVLFVVRPGAARTADAIVVRGTSPHLGVGSCAGSTCHGRSEATGAVVRQDEIRIWQDDSSPAGAHSRAWRVLGEPRARLIAAKLGIGDAQSAPACLGCHSDTMAGGTGFHKSDGVGCEACHGGAQGWLASHYAMGATHAENVARGMIPLDRPRARAEVCLDCHYGSARAGQFVDHRIMAAGHPRLSFELDLFSTLEKHWNEDADFARRVQTPSAATLWAVGQASALTRSLALYANPERGQEGAFPEFYFYDCQSCHRRIYDGPDYRPSASPNPSRPVPPGTPPFQDENMIMLAAAARVAAPELARSFDADSRAFHVALTQGRAPAVAAAARLRADADALADRFSRGVGAGAAYAMVAALGDATTTMRFTDYEGSVQAVMGVDSLLASLTDAGSVSKGEAAAIRPSIDRAYAAVREPNAYQPAAFRVAIAQATQAIAGTRR